MSGDEIAVSGDVSAMLPGRALIVRGEEGAEAAVLESVNGQRA